MGVFARLLGRKPKATEEPDVEAPAGTEPDGSEAANAAEEAAEATAAQGTDEDDDGSAETAAATEPEPAAASAVASTEIPRQQSAKEAADNEAGEGART
ncbi:hypothetical protein ACFZDK_38300 [Streptomyces sp. NPDC007901]|uniref:hypothetical protein n=1 Tax=Streptomyces sp. NPDC007901 TaxID=3364785 RepID=UPI0036EBD367